MSEFIQHGRYRIGIDWDHVKDILAITVLKKREDLIIEVVGSLIVPDPKTAQVKSAGEAAADFYEQLDSDIRSLGEPNPKFLTWADLKTAGYSDEAIAALRRELVDEAYLETKT